MNGAPIIAAIPYAVSLGISVDDMTSERVLATMNWTEDRCTVGGILHGGALMSFADTVGALCAAANIPTGGSTATIESKTNFFRAVRGGTVRASSTPVHVGRTTIVAQTDLVDDQGRLVARVLQTQAVFGPT